jgi:uncharacterized membrane protein YdjX (TVP38/TMEM64 family)
VTSGPHRRRVPGTGLRAALRIALVVGIAAGIVAAWHWRVAFDPQALRRLIADHPAAPLVFLAIHIVASLLFVPRTLLALLAGLVFGMGWGIVWAASGSVLGATAGFLVARYVNSGLVDPAAWVRFGPLLGRVERGGWRMVAIIRLIPVVPHSLANYGLGLTRVRLVPYVVGSLLGQLPLTIAYVDLGTAGERVLHGGADWLLPTLIGLVALSVSLVIPAIARRRARRAQAA